MILEFEVTVIEYQKLCFLKLLVGGDMMHTLCGNNKFMCDQKSLIVNGNILITITN